MVLSKTNNFDDNIMCDTVIVNNPNAVALDVNLSHL